MTEHNAPRDASLPVRFSTAPACPDGQSPVVCLACRHALDVHQPDAATPERLLATCPACLAWHLVRCEPDSGESLIVILPDAAALVPGLKPGRPSPEPGRRRSPDPPPV